MEIILKSFVFGLIASSSIMSLLVGLALPLIIADALSKCCKKLFKKGGSK